ncbi:hypothetical protein BH09PAT1_BH09PAT1_1660 [soil metagenome]
MNNHELLERFKVLYLKKFNKSLSKEQATEMFTDLINLVGVLVKPDQKQNSNIVDLKEKHEHETIRT